MLKSLSLLNFRNHKQRSFVFTKDTNVFLGPNATGKTNILEAITLLATAKSFKTTKSQDLINFDEEFSRISAETKEGEGLEILLTKGIYNGKKVPRKKYLLNGVSKSVKNFAFKFFVVFFKPEDIQVVTGSPGKRRHYLDFVLSQVDWQYQACLKAYQKGLRQRNKLLHLIRENKASSTQLEYWNKLLLKNGEIIQKKRQEYIDFLNSFVSQPEFSNNYSQDIITKLKGFTFEYDPSLITPKRLAQYAQAEIATANTLIGPHRDDLLSFYAQNGERKDLASFASRGQQRMAVLTLKIGQLEFIKAKTSQNPILLLDDIFSELDDQNDQIVLNLIEKQKSFITTTDIDALKTNSQNIEIFKLN